MTIGLDIQVILRLLPQQFERLNVGIMMGGIYEVHRWDGVRWHDIHIKLHKHWTMRSKVVSGEDAHTNSKAISKSTCICLINKVS
jgi:hypothetical protein